MSLEVADPAGFVVNPASKAAVEQGIASAASVTADKVDAVLTVARRRLWDEPARRLAGAVNVETTIHVEDANSVATLQSTVNSIESDTMATALNTALQSANLPTVEVAALSAVVAPTPNQAAAANTEDSDSGARRAATAVAAALAATIVAIA